MLTLQKTLLKNKKQATEWEKLSDKLTKKKEKKILLSKIRQSNFLNGQKM